MFGRKKDKIEKLNIPSRLDVEKIQKVKSFQELRELRENLIKHAIGSGSDSVNVTFFYATSVQVLETMKAISDEFKENGWNLTWTFVTKLKLDKRELFCEYVKFCCERDVVILDIRIS